jgi:AraC-like DNA-binding protein
VRVAEFTSEFGRWDEVERASDPCLRPYVHGYFATSSSLVRPVWERHLPTAEVPMVLNFGASHTRVDAPSDGGPQRLDHAWVTGLQTRHHLSEAIGDRRFMVVRFTPLGAHLFFRLSMDSLTDRAVLLEQIDPEIASLVSDHVMVARGWAERFDAMERLIGSRVARYAAPPYIERAWNGLVRTWGQTPVGSLAADAGCSHRHLIQQFRTCIGLSPKKAAMLLRFNRSIDAVTHDGPADSPRKPYLEGSAPSGTDAPRGRWAQIAAECGYFDQSHFIHEFRAFAGAKPSEFLGGMPTS